MKIMQLCAIDRTIKIFLKPLIRHLMDQGLEVICVCSGGPYTEELKREGLDIINVPIERKVGVLSNIKSIFKLYILFKKERPDVLHVHTPVASALGRIAAKLAKVPIVVYTAHGFYFHDDMPPMKYKLILNIEKYLARYFTDFIFTQSDEDRITAINNRFIDEKKIVCIGNGIDIYGRFNPQNICNAEINKLYKDFKLTDENIIVTFVGRLVREKGIRELVGAFGSIDNDEARLIIVGDMDQGCRDKKTRDLIVRKYKDNRKIIFLGFREDINNILYFTDIFCLPSYREGMPRTIIEAMAMGCAVVATDIRGCREEVIDGETGFLVKPQSEYDIREKLETLIADKRLLNSMKAKGRERAKEQFDERQIVGRQADIINKLYEEYINRGSI